MLDAQVMALIRNLLISGGTALAVKYGLDSSMVPTIAGAIITGTGFIWSAWGHTRNSTIASAAALPEVQAVVASPAVADSVQFMNDDKVITSAQARRFG